jgi:hypothetical protein
MQETRGGLRLLKNKLDLKIYRFYMIFENNVKITYI